MGVRVSRSGGTDWKDYIAGHPERLPRGGGETWADVPAAERRRVDRNFTRWKRRRFARQREPLSFVLRGDALVLED